MLALQIRNVPESVRDVLAERARAQGRSLQSFLLQLIKTEAEPPNRNLEILRRISHSGGGLTEPWSSVSALQEAREERDMQLTRHESAS
ncbi:MAG: FitA-like ribbon-helix-helix domain-containing protein [Candidatus Dormibacteraceae bacterium]